MIAGEVTLSPRYVSLTTRKGSDVRRTLPHRDLFMIGAWCFIDHYGPTQSADLMSIGAHPHTGLQTASWLFSGTIEHRDSLGSIQVINPGELNLMTAGRGIVHSELSLVGGAPLQGVQLWIALPEIARSTSPTFHHYADLPIAVRDGFTCKVFIGEFESLTSSATVYSDLVGVEVSSMSASTGTFALKKNFEYGILVDDGVLEINGRQVKPGELHYLPAGQSEVTLRSDGPTRFLVLGGEPFTEKIVMWWNFIASSHEEIEQARTDWQSLNGERFPSFTDSINDRIPAPEMPNLRLQARSRQRHLPE